MVAVEWDQGLNFRDESYDLWNLMVSQYHTNMYKDIPQIEKICDGREKKTHTKSVL